MKIVETVAPNTFSTLPVGYHYCFQVSLCSIHALESVLRSVNAYVQAE